MTDIVIAEGCRTAFGRFNGAFASVPAPQLGTTAAKEAMKRAKTEPGEVEEVIFGIVLSGNVGGNAARQVCINSGVSETAPAHSINQLCASGMRAVAEAYKTIKLGEASVVLAGGMEKHDRLAARGQPARRHQDGRFQDGRQHAARRSDRSVSTTTTWATPPKISPRNIRLPARTRTSLPQSQSQVRGCDQERPFQRRDRPMSLSRP